MPELILYVRPGCHLCEQAETHLTRLEFRYHCVNVDSDPELRRRFGDDVPVLALGGPPGDLQVLARGVLSRGRLSTLKLGLLRGTIGL